MRNLLLLCIAFISSHAIFAQTNIKGVVLEKNSKTPIEFATVVAGDKTTNLPITGTTTTEDGSFSFETKAKDFYIEVSFLGFIPYRLDEYVIEKGTINIGTIYLEEDSKSLEEVTIAGEKSTVEFKLDKRVFNVGKDLSSTGASALEVLDNVPSVNVDIEGEITLRGNSGVQILINGKPSVLASEESNALGTLTADMIEKVEVVTNPSAKNEAEGAAGIINIVLKKNEKKGLNGSITVNTGIPNNHSVGLSLSMRTEKVNLFSQVGAGYRTFPSEGNGVNRDLTSNVAIENESDAKKNENFYNLILGTDFNINPLNVITVSGNFAFERETEQADIYYDRFDALNTLTDRWLRTDETKATNPKWQYDVQYKKEFKRHKEQAFTLSATGDFFGKDKTSAYVDNYLTSVDSTDRQNSNTNFKEAEYTFKMDYVHPFDRKAIIEVGAQYQMNDVTNDFLVDEFVGGAFEVNPSLSNIFKYNQDVIGVYGTTGYDGEKWGFKVGVRMEHTILNTLLENTNERNDQKYTDFFPSAHLSYKIKPSIQMQIGYSRRISRPNLWNLNPFNNIRNNFNIRTGNPDLLPSYSHSGEFATISKLRKGSVNSSIFYLYTDDVVERVNVFEDNINYSRPENIGNNHAFGFELNGKYTPIKWITMNAEFNFNYFIRKGTFENTSFDFNGNRYNARGGIKFKLPAEVDLEVTLNYRSKFKTLQGTRGNSFHADLGLRKKVLKGKGSINLSIRDIFATRRYEFVNDQPNFYLQSAFQRGQFVTIGFSYGFGKGEAMVFSGNKRF